MLLWEGTGPLIWLFGLGILAFPLIANCSSKEDDIEIVLTPPSFGRIESRSQKVELLAITLTNITDHDVAVTSIAVGCGCLTVDFGGTKVIAPGNQVTSMLRLDPRRMTVGEGQHAVVARSGQAVVGHARVRYLFEPALDAVPAIVYLGPDGSGARLVGQVVVRLFHEGRVQVPVAEVDAARLSANVEAVPGDARSFLLTVRTAAGLPPGLVEGVVKVGIGSGPHESISVPVQGFVDPPIRARPSVVLLGVIPRQTAVERFIDLNGSMPFTVDRIETSSEDIVVTESPGLDGTSRRFLMSVRVADNMKDVLDEHVIITVNSSTVFPVNVRVLAELEPLSMPRESAP